MRPRTVALAALAFVVLLLVVLLAAGSTLPEDHVASAQAVIEAPPAEVYALLSDPVGLTDWRPQIDSVDVLEPVDGRLRWRESSSFGEVTFEQSEAVAEARLVISVVEEPDADFTGSWTYDLEAEGPGSRVTITERGSVTHPFFRLLTRYVVGYHSAMMADLDAMGVHFGHVAAPIEVDPTTREPLP